MTSVPNVAASPVLFRTSSDQDEQMKIALEESLKEAQAAIDEEEQLNTTLAKSREETQAAQMSTPSGGMESSASSELGVGVLDTGGIVPEGGTGCGAHAAGVFQRACPRR